LKSHGEAHQLILETDLSQRFLSSIASSLKPSRIYDKGAANLIDVVLMIEPTTTLMSDPFILHAKHGDNFLS
jgi:hypothetical protein